MNTVQGHTWQFMLVCLYPEQPDHEKCLAERMSSPAIIMRLGVQGLGEIRDACIFIFENWKYTH